MRFPFLMICISCSLFTTCSCNRSGTDTKSNNAPEQQQPRQRKALISIASPKNNEKQPLGTTLALSIKIKDTSETIDSLRWFIDGKHWKTTKGEETTWNTGGQTTGTHRIEAVAHYSSGHRDIVPINMLLLAPQAPKQYTYKVMQIHPHDTKAYTQGLVFDNGFLYESTGQKGESSLRKVNIQTGVPVQAINVPEVFGEGLAMVGDKLIQLTWQDQVAFIYQKSDFKLLSRINYLMREGWGLAYDGKQLLMTDGSATLYFLDSDYLSEVRRLEVCDNKGPVWELNELEYINGELWANVYRTDDILRIDPKTGIVLGRINMKSLLKPGDQQPGIDVLNGIAYDEKTGKIYVTGKNWPKLFEIQVVGK